MSKRSIEIKVRLNKKEMETHFPWGAVYIYSVSGVCSYNFREAVQYDAQ